MISGESTEILSSNTSQAEVKSKALSSHEQRPAESWRIVWIILHCKAFASLAFESQEKFYITKNLSLGSSIKITTGAEIYIHFVVAR